MFKELWVKLPGCAATVKAGKLATTPLPSRNMTIAEAPERTVQRFIQTPAWQETVDQNTLVRDLVSVAKETRREPDFGYFEVIGGALLDPATKEPILRSISTETKLGCPRA